MARMASRVSSRRRKKLSSMFPSRRMVLVAWLVAVAALGGLIYWAWRTQPAKTAQPKVATERRGVAVEKAPAPRHTSEARSVPRNRGESNAGVSPKPATDQAPAPLRQEAAKPNLPAHPNQPESVETMHLAALRPNHGDVSVKPPSLPEHPPLMPPLARVAIVIDDLGLNLEIARKFLEVPLNLTFSILPHQRYSQEIAELAHSNHREVILHMPMEPKGYPKPSPGQGALLLSMSDAARQQSLRSALDASPYFAGINNHMGSRFTEDASLMRAVLEEVHRRGLFFVDSYTSPRSVVEQVAKQVQVPCRRRDIFLDNIQSETAIRTQLRQLIRRAKVQGTALAIGHPHEATLQALLKERDEFDREKIAVVPAGNLISGS